MVGVTNNFRLNRKKSTFCLRSNSPPAFAASYLILLMAIMSASSPSSLVEVEISHR